MNDAELLTQGDELLAAIAPPKAEETVERSHAEEILFRYEEVDAKLVAAGFPETSSWWRSTFQRFYRSGRRQLVPRVGRRGGKSSSFSRLAVVEALYGKHVIPPGDHGTVAIISTDKAEAIGRLTTIKAILDTLGVAYKPLAAPMVGIELVGRPIRFRVFTGSIAGVSGFTAIFVLCDEVAKWLDADTGANPATEVLRSVRPTMATMPNARIVLSSSPLGKLDAHYDAYEEGETDFQCVAFAPTWVSNPSITEADTHTLEPDEATREREYGAVPQAQAETSLLTELLVTRAMRKAPLELPPASGHRYVATMDPATRGNAWTLVLATKGRDNVRRVVLAREWRGSPKEPLSPRAVLKEIAELLAPYGLKSVMTDQWSLDALIDLATDAKLTLVGEPWTHASKREAYEGLVQIAKAEQLELPPDDDVKNDLLGIRKKLTRNGVTYELVTQPNGRHSDFAPAVAMAVQDARWAKAREEQKPEPSDAEKQAAAKAAFLKGLAVDRERAMRHGGRLPATHRPR